MTSSTAALAQAVKEQEQGLMACVHCGFCLPACPTYRRLGDEADSPRGRLYLMQAVVEGRLTADSDAFQTHISRCLGCRACEPVCPSGVAYGHLLELARHSAAEARRPPLLARLLLAVFGKSWLTRPAMLAARLLRAVGFPLLVARLGPPAAVPGPLRLGMAMLAASAPARPPTSSGVAPGSPKPAPLQHPPAPHDPKPARPPSRHPPVPDPPIAPPGTVGVLAGCVQAGLFSRVNHATARVLEANGYRVLPMPGQGCCGALHAHAGDLGAARALARRNVAAVEAAGVDHLAMNASGCGAAVASYGSLLAGDPAFAERAADVAARTMDVSQLLARRGGPAPGGPVPLVATCDAPCHLLHAQGVEGAAETLLAAVPELDLAPLDNAAECCGGAGIYGLSQRELGSRIASDKVQAVLATGAAAVITANPGCMMQIGAGLRLAGKALPVFHPVELLDESYRRAAE